MRTGKVIWLDLRDLSNRRQTGYRELDPGSAYNRYNEHHNCYQDRRSDPHAKAPVRWVMHRPMRSIEGHHEQIEVSGKRIVGNGADDMYR